MVRSDEIVVIVPFKRAADGRRVLGLPKGHVEPGETDEQAARREVEEEAGVLARPVGELGEVSYSFERRGRTVSKQVRFFLFDYISGDVADHDHEIEEASWMPLREAVERLTYAGEREIVRRALMLIAPDR